MVRFLSMRGEGWPAAAGQVQVAVPWHKDAAIRQDACGNAGHPIDFIRLLPSPVSAPGTHPLARAHGLVGPLVELAAGVLLTALVDAPASHDIVVHGLV